MSYLLVLFDFYNLHQKLDKHWDNAGQYMVFAGRLCILGLYSLNIDLQNSNVGFSMFKTA